MTEQRAGPQPLALSVAILAGGRGERLGADKASVLLGGIPLWRHVAARLAPLQSDDLLLVLQPEQAIPEGSPVRIARDVAPGRGVLAGMAAALGAARHSWVLIVGCDMPWASAILARYMYARRAGHAAIVPRQLVGLEPLHALYHRRCLATVQAALARGERRVSRVIRLLDVHYVEEETLARLDPEGRAFVNINTQEELRKAAAWLNADAASRAEE